MSSSGFIHLRVHSAYSLAEGGLKIVEDKHKDGTKAVRQDLIHLCQNNNMPAVAVTDMGNLFGAMEFSMYASGAGLQPIIASQLSVLPEGIPTPPMDRDGYDQLVLLVQNELGYKNLSSLITQSYLRPEAPVPYVTTEELARFSGGLIALTAGTDGAVGHLLLASRRDAAEESLKKLAALFSGRLYVELTRHHGGEIEQAERKIEKDLIDLAYRHNLPLVATNDVFFGSPDLYEAHDALLCIASKRLIADDDRRRLTRDHYFKTAGEMRTLFADIPEACDNTLVIAKRCAFMPPQRKPILPVFSTGAGRDEAAELRAQAEEGLRERLKAAGITDEAPYWERLNYELDIITKMGFPGYFLIVSDFIKWSKSHGIPVGPGRGSGAGSVVAWAILITDLNPIRFGLLFERFLNPERVSMPDFDVDFCQERREKTIYYVQERYGADRVAQIITFGKLQARAALRDVGRVLGMPYGYVDKICKLVPSNPANPVTLQYALETEAPLKQFYDDDPTVQQLFDLAIKLEGLYRNASTHAAGVVIGDRPLVDLCPLYRDPSSPWPVTQFNMKTVEATGLVKFDFLGLKTLDVLQQAVDFLRERDIEVDLSHIPLDDPKTYTMLSRADTTGVFQLESSGMRDVLRKMKPNRIDDIIALVALYRPGPMDNIPTYIKCKNGEEEVHYLHPLLKPILEETFGILIYQEQVMLAAQILAGYSLGGADLLRRAMGKKKVDEMAAQRATFIAGAGKKGIPEDQASLIFDQIDKFAGYGFNKSHAAAYAIVSYQTAYLKANYPVEFFAAAMNFEMGDTDKLNLFRGELTKNGIALMPPDVNRSMASFAAERGTDRKAIRYGLAAIKGVGAAAMEAMTAERETNGPFKDLYDLIERVDPHQINRKQLENLTNAGAFDSLNKNRAQVLASIDLLLQHGRSIAEEKASGQANLFGSQGKDSRPALPKVKPWDELTRLQNEFQALGFYLSAHPLDNYRAMLDRLNVVSVSDVSKKRRALGPNRFKVAGIVLSKQERTAKSGNRFAFVQASDAGGTFEVTVFSELLAAKRDILTAGNALLMEVDAQSGQQGGDDLRFIARNFELLSEVAAKNAKGICIKLFEESSIEEIKKTLDSAPKGRGKVSLRLDLDDEDVEVELEGSYLLTDALKNKIRDIGAGLEVQEY
jgi:DNA polymerase-3 subunit alpha